MVDMATFISLLELRKELVKDCSVELVNMLIEAIEDDDDLPDEIYAYHADDKSGYGVRLVLDISQLQPNEEV